MIMGNDEALKVKFAPEDTITNFHYDFVRKVAGIDIAFLSDESRLSDFNSPEHHPDDRTYWLERIQQEYGINLHDVQDNSLNIGILGSELERRLKRTSLD